MTARLDALRFDPTPGEAGSQTTIRFTLSDSSSAVTLGAGQSTGVSANGRVARLAQPTIAGNAQPGAAVILYDGGTAVVGRGTADAKTGVYAIVASGLAQGANSIAAQQTSHGLTGALGPAVAVTLNTIAPKATRFRVTGPGNCRC